MLQTDSYNTLTGRGEGLFKDRGSKFIAYAFQAHTEEQIKKLINEVRKEHPSARHHCFAWRLGPEKELYKSSDDGEPSGSAGGPILNQLQVNRLYNSLIVVVRYFGGSLLGMNGLINAYKNAAADAIVKTGMRECFVEDRFRALFPTEELNTVMRVLKETGADITQTNFESGYQIDFFLRKSASDLLEKKIGLLYKVKLEKIQ